jgi:hypothetical protein
VGRQDEVGALGDMEAAPDVVAGSLQLIGLCHEEVGGQHATVAYDVYLALAEDAGGNGAQHKLLAVEDYGVAGIGTAGKACHHIILRSEIIYYLSLAFIAEDYAQQGIYFSFCHGLLVMLNISRCSDILLPTGEVNQLSANGKILPALIGRIEEFKSSRVQGVQGVQEFKEFKNLRVEVQFFHFLIF